MWSNNKPHIEFTVDTFNGLQIGLKAKIEITNKIERKV
jgi:hypothetical protein